MILEQIYICMQKVNIDQLYAFSKINSSWITDINAKCKAIKLLEYDIKENLRFGDNF